LAVLIRIGNKLIYKGFKPWDEKYQIKADKFDAFLKKDIKQIEKEVIQKGYKKKGGNGDTRCWYWVGTQLKNILDHPSLHKMDIRWVMDSLEYHAPWASSEINLKPRSKGRRHFKYTLLLIELDDEEKDILLWGEWVTLFDSNSFHSDDRSMIWLKSKLDKFKRFNNQRDAVRKLYPMLNKDFCKKNRDLSYLSDDEFYNEINCVFSEFLRSINGE
tara:strand:+ start:5304 stop:5951 length:648 start_codon:yes stop_codon:yes gene_type:complete